MADEHFDEREQVLRYAAGLQGLSLVRTGDTFALVEYKVAGATLDEIAGFLTADRTTATENHGVEEQRRTDLRAMLKAEHALLIEFKEQMGRGGERSADPESTEDALAEIGRRIAELQDANQRRS